MDDIIFEKDYRETESAEYDKWCDEVFDRAVNCGMLKAYSEAMDKIPKIIVPEDKKNYEYLLERCDAFVKQHRGYIKGIVDYHRWHAEINMFLPFAEFDDSEDLAFLKEIAEKSQTVCFSPEEEGGIRVHIFINYFEELMSAEHKSYIEYDAIMQDKKLSELLGIPELSAVVCRDVLQGCIQKHIAHHQLAVRGHILECNGHHIRLSVRAGGQIPHPAFQQPDNIFIQHNSSSLYPELYGSLVMLIIEQI